MVLAPFDYAAPESLEKAIELLQQYPDKARLLAGGQSLLTAMKLHQTRDPTASVILPWFSFTFASLPF